MKNKRIYSDLIIRFRMAPYIRYCCPEQKPLTPYGYKSLLTVCLITSFPHTLTLPRSSFPVFSLPVVEVDLLSSNPRHHILSFYPLNQLKRVLIALPLVTFAIPSA